MFGKTRTFAVPEKWTLDVNVCGGCDGYAVLDLALFADQAGEAGATGGDALVSEDAGFDATRVTMLTIIHSGSAGIDNLVFELPEPGLVGMLGVALALLGVRRRR